MSKGNAIARQRKSMLSYLMRSRHKDMKSFRKPQTETRVWNPGAGKPGPEFRVKGIRLRAPNTGEPEFRFQGVISRSWYYVQESSNMVKSYTNQSLI